jgi:glutamate synthase (NADPH/NADH) small chain
MEEIEKKEKKEKIPRQPMPEQEPKVRAKNFEEVPFGYSPETAMREASRCIQCKNPGCMTGCPVEIDIPAFINRVKEGDFKGAIAKIKEKNALPAVPKRYSVKITVSLARRENLLPLVV